MLKIINTIKTLSLCLFSVAGLCLLLVAIYSFSSAFAVSPDSNGKTTPAKNSLIPGTTIYGYNFGSDEAGRLAKDGVFIGNDSKNCYLDLAYGNILLHPEKDMVVCTGLSKIYVGADAMVFIIDSGPDLVVYDLQETRAKQVVVTTGKCKLVMEPGRLLVLTADNSKDFELLNVNCHSIPYKNVQRLNLPGEPLNVFVADFSIASALNTIQPLKHLTISKH